MPWLEAHHGAYIIHGRGHGRDGTLIQSDWDYPAVASLFGWSLRRVQKDRKGKVHELDRAPRRGVGCDHSRTDGTITCPDCGVTATSFIGAAGWFLNDIAT